jgi:hypothetical protein
MNPFEEFLRRLFGSGPPPTMRAEEEEAARMPRVARNMPSVAADIGRSFVDAYKQRSLDLQDLANRQAGGALGMYQPLSDYGEDPRAADLARAQRDLALDVLSAGAMGPATSASIGMLSSAPGIGGSTARNAGMDVLARLRQNPLFANVPEIDPAEATYRQFGATVPEARAALNEQLQTRALRPEIQSVQQNPVLHSSPHFFLDPRIDPATARTGEGHQMWGPGLYVAEGPGTASSYRESLRRYFGSPTLAGIPFDPYTVSQLRQDPRYKEFVDRLIGSRTSIWDPEDRKAMGKIEQYYDESRPSGLNTARRSLNNYRGRVDFYENLVSEQKNLLQRSRQRLDEILQSETFSPQMKQILSEGEKENISALETYVSEAQENMGRAKKDYRKELKAFGSAEKRAATKIRAKLPEASTVTYRGTFGANPDEILNLTEPYFGFGGISGTPFEAAILNLPQGRQKLALYEQTMQNAMARVRELPVGISWQDYQNLPFDDPTKAYARQVESDVTEAQKNLIKGFEPTIQRTSVRGTDPQRVMALMIDEGIVGTRFPDALSRGFNVLKPTGMPISDIPTFNYTVYRPDRIQFQSAFAANPLLPLSSVMSQMQKDKEKKKK